MILNLPNILMLYGALQGLFLCAFILRKESYKKAGRYLVIMLFGLSMNLLFYFSADAGIIKRYPLIRNLYLPWALLSCVCFYFYIVFSAPFQKTLTKKEKLAFIPFILFSVTHIIIRILIYIYGKNLNYTIINAIYAFEEFFGIFYCIFFGILSYIRINKTEEKIRELFSNYNISKLSFHKKLLRLMLMFCLLWGTLYSYSIVNNLNSIKVFYIPWLFIAFVLQWIAWSGFIKSERLLPVFNKDKKSKIIDSSISILKTENRDTTKHTKIQKTNPLYLALIKLFEQEEIYRQPNLSLAILAEKLNISKSYLSAIINQTTDKNFYDFVNNYRVNHLISLFKSGNTQNFTILSLAFESGFNSKSTFQAAFKKIKGKTPTQYLKQM